ncbi:uncharacterized protein [Ptychodera flava]|uniref:uncharacterized protein isoform X2 n=1 Tax=Ptychodera flava TaxID=63121 RepID=UPI003969C2BA
MEMLIPWSFIKSGCVIDGPLLPYNKSNYPVIVTCFTSLKIAHCDVHLQSETKFGLIVGASNNIMGLKQSKTSPSLCTSASDSNSNSDRVNSNLPEKKVDGTSEGKKRTQVTLTKKRRGERRRSKNTTPKILDGKAEASGLSNVSVRECCSVDIAKYQYPFENIAFEGGGNKGLAYCGALKVLDEVGVLDKLHRFAGASAGALTATLLAVGYDVEDIRRYLCQDLRKIIIDHKCGYCSLLPNLVRHYGWNPGRNLLHWLGLRLQETTGNANVTFKELYEKFGNELCVVVTNLNRMDTEYCHVKTTPNMQIRVALRMSISIPGLFQCVRHKNGSEEDIYVDGGLLCNYPIHCFDGWWLSMKPEDNYLKKLQNLDDIGRLWDKKERFGEFNKNTIGLLLFSGDESEVMKSQLCQREGMSTCVSQRPDTKLARRKTKMKKMKEESATRHALLVEAMSKFLQVLNISDLNQNVMISKDELRTALKETSVFTEHHFAALFGDVNCIDGIFDLLDVSDDGQEEDVDRTIGIDTDYVETNDFDMEQADKEFVFEQGAIGARAYLKYYITKYKPPLKEGKS